MNVFKIDATGGPCDVCFLNGYLFLAYQSGTGENAHVVVEVYPKDGGDKVIGAQWRSSSGAFPRLYAAHGSWWLAYRDDQEHITLRRDGEVAWKSPVPSGGNDPVCFGRDRDDRHSFAWQATLTNEIFVAPLLKTNDQIPEGAGRPTGLSHIAGSVETVDEARASVTGMTRPAWAGAVVVGEHPDSGVRVRHEDGREHTFWTGHYTYTPRVAVDGPLYALTTWNGAYGPMLLTFTSADLVANPTVSPWPPGDGWTRRDDITEIDIVEYLLGAEWSRNGMHVTDTEGGVTYSHPFQSRVLKAGCVQHTKFAPPDTRSATWTYTDQWVGLAFDGTNEASQGYRIVVPGTDDTAAIYPRRMRVGKQYARTVDVEIIYLASGVRRSATFSGWVEAVYDGPQIGDIPPTTHAVVMFEPASTETGGWREMNIGARMLGCWYWHRVRKSADATPDMRWIGTRNAPRVPDIPAQFTSARPVVPTPQPPTPTPDPPKPPMPTLKNRDQFFAEFTEINDFYAAEEGLQRPGGMVIDGGCDVVAMRQWGYDLMAGATVAQVKTQIRKSDEWKEKHTEGEHQTPPPSGENPPPPGTIAGPLRRRGRVLYDDSGDKLILSTTMMQATTLLEHEPALFSDNIAASVEGGIDEWRIGGVVNWPMDVQDEVPTEPRHVEKIVETIDRLAASGIRTDLCLFLAQSDVPELASLGACEDYTRNVCRALKDRAHAIRITVANEPGDTRVWRLGLDGLRRIRDVVKQELPTVLVALGAPWHPNSLGTCEWTEGSREDGENALPWFGEGCDIISPHYGRNGNERRDARQPWLGRRDSGGTDCVMNNEEPIGPYNYYRNDGSLHSLNEQRPDVLGMEMTAAWCQGHAITTWHTGAGIGYQRLARVPAYFALRDMPGFRYVAAAKAVLPGGLPGYQFANWHWSVAQGQLFSRNYEPSDTGGTPATRGHCAVRGDQFVDHEFCAERQYDIIARVPVEFSMWDRQGTVFVKVGEYRLGANERMTLQPCLDRLLVGRIR